MKKILLILEDREFNELKRLYVSLKKINAKIDKWENFFLYLKESYKKDGERDG